jgi:hypothetical protein
MSAIADNLQAVQARIREAKRAGRSPESVRLLAVSKTWPLSSVMAAVDAGQHAFGENYVQEGIEKLPPLPGNISNGILLARCRATSRALLPNILTGYIPLTASRLPSASRTNVRATCRRCRSASR